MPLHSIAANVHLHLNFKVKLLADLTSFRVETYLKANKNVLHTTRKEKQ